MTGVQTLRHRPITFNRRPMDSTSARRRHTPSWASPSPSPADAGKPSQTSPRKFPETQCGPPSLTVARARNQPHNDATLHLPHTQPHTRQPTFIATYTQSGPPRHHPRTSNLALRSVPFRYGTLG